MTANKAVEVTGFGGPETLRVVDAPMPMAGRGEVRVRMLASALEYTDTLIRRHLYPQTMFRRPPFIPGYGLIGEIDQLGEGVGGFQVGDRVADITVTGSSTTWCSLPIGALARVPAGVDPAEAAAMVLSWTTACQLLHRSARVQAGQRVLVQGAAGAVGQALLTLGRLANLQIWGTARAEHAGIVRGLGGVPIDFQNEDFTRVVPGGFDVVFDGIGEDRYRRAFAALRPGGVLCIYGYSANVRPGQRLSALLMQLLTVYLSRQLLAWRPGGKHVRVYSINLMRAQHPAWFRDDLEKLFGLLAARTIVPRIAGRIPMEKVGEAYRLIEAGGLDGKLVLCPP